MRRRSCFGIVVVVLWVASAVLSVPVSAAPWPPVAYLPLVAQGAGVQSTSLKEYQVPGNPAFIAAGTPGQVWFTMPARNQIGRLNTTSPNPIGTYDVPTSNSEPYRIVFAGGMVWFSELSGNKIGRLDPATGIISEFPLPTADARPSGLDVMTGNPTTVWFTESSTSANAIGRLVVTDTLHFAINEYSISASASNAKPEEIHIQNSNLIWFSAPGASRIYLFVLSAWPNPVAALAFVPMGTGSQPWAIDMDGRGFLWATDRSLGRILEVYPTTMQWTNVYWLPTVAADPFDMLVHSRTIWFTELNGNALGRLQITGTATGAFTEFALISNSQPMGLTRDADGCIWVAEYGGSRIGSLCLQPLYLPMIQRSR